MISHLSGKVLQQGSNYLIIEVGGIGYKVTVTPEIFSLIKDGQVAVYTYHKFSDTEQALFGVPDWETLEFFELLTTVSGVGPKLAITMLSSATASVLKDAISRQDANIFTRMSGVGKKTAERIILELKNKLSAGPLGGGGGDVFDALLGLGYSAKEAREVFSKVDSSLPQDEQLKLALKLLSTK